MQALVYQETLSYKVSNLLQLKDPSHKQIKQGTASATFWKSSYFTKTESPRKMLLNWVIAKTHYEKRSSKAANQSRIFVAPQKGMAERQ